MVERNSGVVSGVSNLKSKLKSVVVIVLFVLGFIIGLSVITDHNSVLPVTVKGLFVHIYYDAATYFPLHWSAGEPGCEAQQADLADVKRMLPIIEEFASVYSSDLIAHNLKDIYLLSDLECYGNPYGGTYYTSSLYISLGSKEQGYTTEFLSAMLHGEFSSILMGNYTFPYGAWAAVNKADFVYTDNATQVVGEPAMYNQTKALFRGGFLWQYSTTSLENDFNDIASWLFTHQAELCDLRRQYPRIEKKANLAIDFYQSVNPEIKFVRCK